MHLVIVSAFRYPNGGPAAARHLAMASGLLGDGHQVSVILLNQVGPVHGAEGQGSINWMSVAAGQRSSLGWRLAAARRLGPALGALAKVDRIDAVLLTGLDPILLQAGLSAARKRALTVFHELTEYPDVVGPGGVYGWLSRVLFERRFMPALDGMLVISHALDKYVRQRTKSPVQIVGAMVDTTTHNPLVPISMDSSMTIGYAGSLSEAKDGVLTLLAAVAQAQALLPPEFEIRVRVLGDTESLDGQLAVKRAYQLGIENRVTFHGLVPHAEVRELLQDCHVLVLPRPDSKQARGGFPTKLGEYLSTARPVLTTGVGDIPLYLRDRENCLMVRPGDVVEIARTLAYVGMHYAAAQRIGERGRVVVEDAFNAKVQSRKVAAFVTRFSK